MATKKQSEKPKMISSVGKRKTSIARIMMRDGNGAITVNKVNAPDYFKRPTLQMIIDQPLELVGLKGSLDVIVNANGGGLSGQAEAIRHGIAKALMAYDISFRAKLKSAGFLTRDSRIRERKKYGQKGARARYQFSKR